MTQAERVEVLILGSGKSGKLLAWDLAGAGHRTVCIERKWIGGSCPNINCLPSKNEIKSAEVADVVHHAGAFGTVATAVRTDMTQVLARKRQMVEAEVAFHLQAFRASGAELVLGQARFVGKKTVEVSLNDGGTRLLSGDRVFLNLGTRPSVPAVPGLAAAAMTNIEMLELDRVPERLVVLGGGYVGLEFAQAYRRFGSRVTILEQGPQVLAREDPDVAEAVQRLLADEEIEVVLGAQVLRVDGQRGAVRVVVRASGGERTIAATDVLAATGRSPNTSDVGLDVAGVALDQRGYIAVNERLETSAPDVWALGECAGSPQFTHIAGDDYRVVRDNLRGGKRTTRGRQVPLDCVFIDPAAGAHRLERTRSAQQWCAGSCRDAAGQADPPDRDDGGDTRLHEGAGPRSARRHPGVHDVRRRCGRSHGRGSGGHVGRAAFHGPARCRSRPSPRWPRVSALCSRMSR